MSRLPLRDRFLKHVKKTRGCWHWIGSIRKDGYGTLGIESKTKLAHRVSYELFQKKPPKGLTLDHLCRNRACVNPKHLEPVSFKENILRGISPSALNARKRFCPQGHPYSVENTIADCGGRRCRICRNTRRQRRRAKQRLHGLKVE